MNICAVILAAGQGKRMNSKKPKVLHEVLGRPMLQYTVDTLKSLNPGQLIIVVGKESEEVKKAVKCDSASFVRQAKPLGTGNALIEAGKTMRGLKNSIILVINGDSPLMTLKTLKVFLKKHQRVNNDISFLSFIDSSSSGYGRVLRNGHGRVTGILEDKHAGTQEKQNIKELNGGVYAFKPDILKYLKTLKKHPSSGEYYLTDIIGIAAKNRKKVEAYNCPPEETKGINNRAELHQAIRFLNSRGISGWIKKGITFIDPSTSIVHLSVSIGRDTVIYPNTYLEGDTAIGKNCTIYPGVRICDSVIGNGVSIKDNTLIETSRVRDGSTIGPFAHLRPYSDIGRNVKIGNFVEIKKSIIGDGTKASHLSYLGDAEIGKNVNIGAGTITCNYDGRKKHTSVIGSGVFIGSDSQIIAPVKVGKDAYIAAGSTITKDVPEGALAISRVRQENLKTLGKKAKNKKRR